MNELNYYEVEINGIAHTLKLSDQDQERRYPNAKRVDGPSKSEQAQKAEQLANAPAGQVSVAQVVTSPDLSGQEAPAVAVPVGSGTAEETSLPGVAKVSRAATKK